MAPIAIITGALMCVVGAIFYGISPVDHRSITALIPLFLGFPIAICGFVARKEALRKHAMHGAVLFAILGLLGSLRGAKHWIAFASGQEPVLGLAATEMLVLFIITVVFTVLCVRSFIAARKARTA